MIKTAIYLIIILLITLVQLGFISCYEALRPIVNLVLIYLIILTWSTSIKKSLPWIILAGLFLEFQSVLTFGVILATLTLSVFITWLLQKKIFKSKSLFSLIIILISGALTYHLLLIGISYLFFSFGQSNFNLYKNIHNWPYFLLDSAMINTFLGMIMILIEKLFLKTVNKRFMISVR